jgi:hypothetical protein
MNEVVAVFTVNGDPERLLVAYDRAISELQAAADEIGAPVAHICASTEDGLRIVDVWQSGGALRTFAEHPRFRAIIREAGLPEPAAIEVLPVHALGRPAAAAVG